MTYCNEIPSEQTFLMGDMPCKTLLMFLLLWTAKLNMAAYGLHLLSANQNVGICPKLFYLERSCEAKGRHGENEAVNC